ncbi:uncharacterized protein E5676_scaffold255G003670 [Cucumis melo var. makuwa]|uniref:Uncharacterized protein n=1 Tax=Cucumis melo var. makuwa TaxID=1194695 RepID=A0A5A7SYS6_CUCMM|nr:uncharacterized protein E6C27_scaffold18G001830 [Cucumis melo var. makuwa]TYK12778.1 uncharacterized protein E5676_scaffold255G003670 [Cucumis melo var. makuwa]
MATATVKPPRPKLACFSFAAYAKTVIDHLKSLQIPVLPGLSDPEFTSVESTFRFSFPPDLRSILQEGLPIGSGFPNWRSSSIQQLHILINLPKFCLLKEISQRKFWCQSWGAQPDDSNDAVALAKQFLDRAPVLVPIYKNWYIPSAPNMAGNPVFHLDGGEIRVSSFDLAGFFQAHEYSQLGKAEPDCLVIDSPAWAATEARAVEFWTEVASRKKAKAREVTEGWWNEGEFEMGLDGCLEDVFWKLREGGWREDDVRDMMMMDRHDRSLEQNETTMEKLRVSVGEILLSGGWSRDDVVYSLDLECNSAIVIPDEESTFEINLHHYHHHQPIRIPQVERKKKPRNTTTTNHLKMPPFFFAPHRNLIL